MESGDGIAAGGLAAFDPQNDRQPSDAELAQVVAPVGGGAFDEVLGPDRGPNFAGAEFGEGFPVFERLFDIIGDLHAALLGAVDEEHAAERFERGAAKAGFALALEDGDALAGLEEFERGDDARDAAAHDRHVALVGFGHRLDSFWPRRIRGRGGLSQWRRWANMGLRLRIAQ